MPAVVGGVSWYGQQEAHRVAFYDTYRRFGLARFRSDDVELLDLHTALTGATGWWWAFDDVCVMANDPPPFMPSPYRAVYTTNADCTTRMRLRSNSTTVYHFSCITGSSCPTE